MMTWNSARKKPEKKIFSCRLHLTKVYVSFFNIDNIFDFLGALYDGRKELLHLLVHADDATVIAGDRVSVINKLRSLLSYCNQNCIIHQYTKCEFMVTNGSDADHEPIPFGAENLKSVEHILCR